MAQTFTTQSLVQMLAFPFKDPHWMKKMAIGGAITLLSPFLLLIPSTFVEGYYLRIMKGIIVDRKDPSMPEWDDWEGLFIDGCRLIGVALVYLLPAILVASVGISFAILPIVITAGSRNTGAMDQTFLLFSNFTAQGLFMFTFLLSSLASIISAAGFGHLVARDSFKAGFAVRGWWPIFRANLGGFVISFILFMALNWMVTMGAEVLIFTVILCVIGLLAACLAGFYVNAVKYALFALAYREGADRVSPPLPPQVELIEVGGNL
jgi:hypothetical protein